MILLNIAIGGFIGAITRFYFSKKLNKKWPLGTFLVNTIGSFLLGYFFSLGLSKNMYALLGTGFCGSFTTFSTFKLETYQMILDNRKLTSIVYLIVSYLFGILFAFAGFAFARN